MAFIGSRSNPRIRLIKGEQGNPNTPFSYGGSISQPINLSRIIKTRSYNPIPFGIYKKIMRFLNDNVPGGVTSAFIDSNGDIIVLSIEDFTLNVATPKTNYNYYKLNYKLIPVPSFTNTSIPALVTHQVTPENDYIIDGLIVGNYIYSCGTVNRLTGFKRDSCVQSLHKNTGILNNSFGTAGNFILDASLGGNVPPQNVFYNIESFSDRLIICGYYEFQPNPLLMAIDYNGNLINTFTDGSTPLNGIVTNNANYSMSNKRNTRIIKNDNTTFFVLGEGALNNNTEIVLDKLNVSDGSYNTTFAVNGTFIYDMNNTGITCLRCFTNGLVVDDKYIYIAGEFVDVSNEDYMYILKIDRVTGVLVNDFANNGVLVIDLEGQTNLRIVNPDSLSEIIYDMALDLKTHKNNKIYVCGAISERSSGIIVKEGPSIICINAENGSIVKSFGKNGLYEIDNNTVTPIERYVKFATKYKQPDNSLTVVGYYGNDVKPNGFVEKLFIK